MALRYPSTIFGGRGSQLQVYLGDMTSAFCNSFPLVHRNDKEEGMSIHQITVRYPAYTPVATYSTSKDVIPILPMLRHLGFPMTTDSANGDPFALERVGVIDAHGVIHWPNYYIQRSLIDEDGNLIYLGLDATKAIPLRGSSWYRLSTCRRCAGRSEEFLLTRQLSDTTHFLSSRKQCCR